MLESLSVGLLTAEKMRATDAAAIDGLGIPGGHLMERAAPPWPASSCSPSSPRAWSSSRARATTAATASSSPASCSTPASRSPCGDRRADAYKGDARLNLEIAEKLGIEIVDGVEPVGDADVAVDAVFGTGFTGVAKGAPAAAIAEMNASGAAVVALDIASGVGASTGEVAGPAVLADLTVALHAAEDGPFRQPGAAAPDTSWSCPSASRRPATSSRRLAAHARRGRPGRASQGRGRPQALGGHRAGGRRLARHERRRGHGRARRAALRRRPRALPSAGRPGLREALPRGHQRRGPGRGPPGPREVPRPYAPRWASSGPRRSVPAWAATTTPSPWYASWSPADRRPLVIDADGLFALGTGLESLAGRTAPTVLTPHEGELARLLGTSGGRGRRASPGERPRGRPAQRRDRAAQGRAPPVVADPDRHRLRRATGNPGLATPGTGDVLTGIVAGQLAKGLSGTEAACLAGFVHGLAADLAVETRGQRRGHDRKRPLRLSAARGRAARPGRGDHDHHDHDHDH